MRQILAVILVALLLSGCLRLAFNDYPITPAQEQTEGETE